MLSDNLPYTSDMLSMDASYNALVGRLLLGQPVFGLNLHLLDSISMLL